MTCEDRQDRSLALRQIYSCSKSFSRRLDKRAALIEFRLFGEKLFSFEMWKQNKNSQADEGNKRGTFSPGLTRHEAAAAASYL